MGDNLREQGIKGFLWALLERLSVQAVTFVVTLVLARILSPSDYGTVALLSIFLAVAGVLVDSGFGNALIQKKNATELDFNSVFYVSIGIGFVAYIALFFMAPFVAAFYNSDILVPILRVSATTLLFASINSVQNAALARKLLFKLSFRVSLLSTIASAITGIVLAVLGYGPWALVWSVFSSNLVGTVARWIAIGWRPKLMFSFDSLKGLFSYGWKVSVTGLVDTLYNNIYGLLIGKMYSKEDLAFVNKGRHMPELLMQTISATLSRVAFPVMSQVQDDDVRIRSMMSKVLKVSCFAVFPVLGFCAVSAKSITIILFGEKWLPIVPYMQLACTMYAFSPFNVVNLQVLLSKGRSDLYLKLEIIKKIIGVIVVIASVQYSPLCLVAAMSLIVYPVCLVINTWPISRLVGYGLFAQVRDVFVPLILTAALIVCSYVSANACRVVRCDSTYFSCLLSLSISALAGFGVYACAAYFMRAEPMIAILQIIGRHRNNNKEV